jgi:leucyl aminopeptidase
MNFELTIKPMNEITADIEVIFVIDNNMKHTFIKDRKPLKMAGFTGAQDETLLLVESHKLYVGVESLGTQNIRTASASAMKALKNTKYKELKIATYASFEDDTKSVRAMVEGLLLGEYHFDKYKSKKSKSSIRSAIISLEEFHGFSLDIQRCAEALHRGQITAEATNFARDIVNTPPEDCYPKVLAKTAETMAKQIGLDYHILKPKKLQAEGMRALLAVARASRHKPRVIHLVHRPKHAMAVISLVGKGLTYDSGGLSLKPSDFMVTMKADKSGASTVIGILKAVGELDLPIEVHGFVGAVENMIGGDAYKPDDVLKAKNGTTIEVRNTDAEGRLVLADTLAYAQQEVAADYIFDFATLTGACVVGVGNYTSGIMGFHDTPKKLLLEAAEESGEFATKLDFNRYLKKTLRSEIADISNISNTRYGGAITAGQFLSEFIDEKHTDRWAHIDIAGPAFVEHEWGENPYGASGAGVRMMIKLLEKLVDKEA